MTTAVCYVPHLCVQFGPVPCIVNLAARLDVRQGVVRRLGQQVLSELEANGKVRPSLVLLVVQRMVMGLRV